MPRLLVALLGFTSTCLFIGGCGGGESLYTVEGKVLIDGQPATTGSVRFVPDAAKGNVGKHEPAGEIGSDGSYKLMTLGKPGAPAGWYKVSITSTEPLDSAKPKAAKSFVAKRYGDPLTSTLTVEVVKSGGSYELKTEAK